MFPGTLLYNVLVGAAWLSLLRLTRRTPAGVAAGLLGAVPLAIGGLAMALGEGHFGILRLLAWGIFLHLPLVFAALTWQARRRRAAAASCGLGALVLLAIAGDAFLAEPRWLEVTTYRLSSPKVSRPLRIALVADLQTDHIGDYEERVLARTLAERPDLVLFAGDYLHVYDPVRRRAQLDRLRGLLARLHFAAPLGVYAVPGNVDGPEWEDAFRDLPVTTFEKTGWVDLPELRVSALALADSFSQSVRLEPTARFHLAFGHAPDFALSSVDADLLLAGHTHRGQVRWPGIGPLMTLFAVPRSWAAGRTEIAPGRTLVVSRGIGMERGYAPRLRFLCRPELAMIELRPAAPAGG